MKNSKNQNPPSASESEESEDAVQPDFPKPDPKKSNKNSKTTMKNRKTPPPPSDSEDSDRPESPKSDPKKSSGSKRVAEKDPEPSRAKKRLVLEDEDKEKKPLFQRLWSEDDELVILQGVKDYLKKRGTATDAFVNMDAFHSFIKKNLHVEASASQLHNKLRRLKKKFLNNVAKDGKNKTKKPLVFTKPHEQKTFDLSKKVWGHDGKLLEPAKDDNEEKNVGGGRQLQSRVGKSGGEGTNSGVSMKKIGNVVGDEMVSKGLEMLEESKRVEMEEKWRKLRAEEYELYLMKLDLISKQSMMFLDAMKGAEKMKDD